MANANLSPSSVARVMLVVGSLGVAGAFLVDVFGGAPGWGLLQSVALLVGLGCLGFGLFLRTARGHAWLEGLPLLQRGPDYRGVVWTALWFGLLAGLLDPLLIQLQVGVGHRFAYLNPHMSWMSPLSYTLCFLVIAAGLAAVGRGAMGWIASKRIAATVFAFLTAWSLALLYHPEISFLAGTVLALGIGVQISRVLADETRLTNFMRRSRAVLVSGVLLATGLHVGLPWAKERIAAAGIDAQDVPNVVLIVLDTVRAANLSLNGYGRETTPNLDRRAASSVVFERAISTGPYSMTSHSSLATGLYPHDFSADWVTPLDGSHLRLSEVLAEQGFLTGGFFANRGYGGRHTGLEQGFHHWDADIITGWELLAASQVGRMMVRPRHRLSFNLHNHNEFGQKRGGTVTDEFLAWIGRGGDRPFFAFLNYFDAHSPYVSPPGWASSFDDVPRPETPRSSFDQSASERRVRRTNAVDGYLEAYDDSILFLDNELGRIFSELERLGIYDNTLIIVTSDHGEEFAEKGFYVGHSRTLHYPVVHVPLFIRYPEGQWGGSRVEDPVSIRDVPATVLRAIGIADHTMPGEALQRYTMDSTEPEGTRPPEFVLAEVTDRAWVADTSRAVGGVERSGTAGNDPTFRNHMIALFQGAHQYIRSADGTEQLYDLDQDRWGQRDLASDTTFREYLARFREATDSIAVDYFQRRPVIR